MKRHGGSNFLFFNLYQLQTSSWWRTRSSFFILKIGVSPNEVSNYYLLFGAINILGRTIWMPQTSGAFFISFAYITFKCLSSDSYFMKWKTFIIKLSKTLRFFVKSFLITEKKTSFLFKNWSFVRKKIIRNNRLVKNIKPNSN